MCKIKKDINMEQFNLTCMPTCKDCQSMCVIDPLDVKSFAPENYEVVQSKLELYVNLD